MKHRNPVAVALWPMFTLGIYSLWWLNATSKELRSKGYKIPPLWVLFAPLAGLLLLAILSVIGMLTSDAIGVLRVVTNVLDLVLGAVCFITIIPLTLYWYYMYAKAVHNVTNGKLSDIMTLLLLYFLGSIGMAIIQDSFNKLPDVPQADGAAPAVAGPTITTPTTPTTQPPTGVTS